MIQKITRIPLREAFRHEALDFAKWLQDNLDAVNDVTDLTLSNAEREKSAGDFSVDLVAEDEGGNKVIIENQERILGKTRHSPRVLGTVARLRKKQDQTPRIHFPQ